MSSIVIIQICIRCKLYKNCLTEFFGNYTNDIAEKPNRPRYLYQLYQWYCRETWRRGLVLSQQNIRGSTPTTASRLSQAQEVLVSIRPQCESSVTFA